jgi:hypothetical protein
MGWMISRKWTIHGCRGMALPGAATRNAVISTESDHEQKTAGNPLKMVQRQGFVSIEALAQSLNVTPQTVRRDINALCDQQLLTRYHGGAGIASSVENIAKSLVDHQPGLK